MKRTFGMRIGKSLIFSILTQSPTLMLFQLVILINITITNKHRQKIFVTVYCANIFVFEIFKQQYDDTTTQRNCSRIFYIQEYALCTSSLFTKITRKRLIIYFSHDYKNMYALYGISLS